MHHLTYTNSKKNTITYNILNLLCMLHVLHVCRWRGMFKIQCNDLTCDTHVPSHILLPRNHMVHTYKYLIFLCISL